MLEKEEKLMILVALYTYKNLEQAECKREYEKLYKRLLKEWTDCE